MKYRLGWLHHPIHYHAPLMRELAKDPEIDLRVFLLRRTRQSHDREFGTSYTWTYRCWKAMSMSLRNSSPWPSTAPIKGVFNPGIWQAIRRGNFDAFWVHGYVSPTIWLAVAAAKTHGTKVFLRGESTLLYPRSATMLLVKRLALKVLFSAVDRFLTIGSKNARFYGAHGIPNERMVLTPYCVDNESFLAARQADPGMGERTRKGLGIGLADPVILFVGKLIERKRPADLLRAYESLLADHPRAALILVGDGDQRASLEAEVKRRGLDRVHFPGFKNRTEISQYYACADVFVLPSMHDPWGLVINEAMCFSLPIIASSLVGSVDDLVREEENGFIFPAGNVERLAASLKRLLDDPDLCGNGWAKNPSR